MNFVLNKKFYQRIHRLNTKSSVNKSNHSKDKPTSADETVIDPVEGVAASSIRTKTSKEQGTRQNLEPDLNSICQENTISGPTVITVLTEGRGEAQGEVGLASIDLDSPSLLLCQFSDGYWYNGCMIKLQLLNPQEIIVPHTIYNNGSKMLDAISANFSKIKITPLPRRHFNNDDAEEFIQRFCTPDSKTSLIVVRKKYYAMMAASALIKYLKYVLMIEFETNSLKLEFHSRYGRMLLDHETSHRLELLYPLCFTKEKKACLFGVLDNTTTAVGKRYLRARILEPYCNLTDIKKNQECITELLNDPKMFLCLEETLKNFFTVEKILKLCIIQIKEKTDNVKGIETILNQTLLLKSCLLCVPKLSKILGKFKAEIFKDLNKILKDKRFEKIISEIDRVIQPEIQHRRGAVQLFQRIFAIRPGICDLLDLSRHKYTELADIIRNIITNLTTTLGIPLRMIHTVQKGFHIQINKKGITAPAELTLLYVKGNSTFFTNEEIKILNFRINDVIQEIHRNSYIAIRNLIKSIVLHADVNYSLIEAISKIDIIISLSKVSMKEGFCLPTFSDETKIVDAVHPLLEYSRTKPIPVSNNIIGTPEYNSFVITGPNMGGKTIYIKTIALIQIMAQLGCYVPAKTATIRICDNIFTRIGFEDNIEQNASSFQVEIREMEYIFRNISPNSLVLIDELCKSTNAIEGAQLAMKLCTKLFSLKGIKNDGKYFADDKDDTNNKPEETISSFASTFRNIKIFDVTAPFIYITTHFKELTKLPEIYYNVVNLHLYAEEHYVYDKLKLKYTHKVQDGATSIQGYGISLARTIGLPSDFVLRAEQILSDILAKNEQISRESTNSIQPTQTNLIFRDLEQSLKLSETPILQHNANTTISSISNFMNPCLSTNERTPRNQSNKNITIDEFLKYFGFQLYDCYSRIAAVYRSEEDNSTQKSSMQIIIRDFIENLPKEVSETIIDNSKFKQPLLTTSRRNKSKGRKFSNATSTKNYFKNYTLKQPSIIDSANGSSNKIRIDKVPAPSNQHPKVPAYNFNSEHNQKRTSRRSNLENIPPNTVCNTTLNLPRNLNNVPYTSASSTNMSGPSNIRRMISSRNINTNSTEISSSRNTRTENTDLAQISYHSFLRRRAAGCFGPSAGRSCHSSSRSFYNVSSISSSRRCSRRDILHRTESYMSTGSNITTVRDARGKKVIQNIQARKIIKRVFIRPRSGTPVNVSRVMRMGRSNLTRGSHKSCNISQYREYRN